MCVWEEKDGERVACCTRVLDTQGATLEGIGGSLASMGAAARPVVLSVYILLNCLTIVGVWLVGRDGGRRTRTVSAAWTLALALLGALAWVFWLEPWKSRVTI